ncbi:MAG: VOC family protein [Intrasporangiaceae bacterium]|nr:VOC family protein [Intrasporangiaceae bacterium]
MASWFSYEYTRDVGATRRFYRDLIGLEPVWDGPDSVGFVHDCVQVTFDYAEDAPERQAWACQPGWSNGQLADAPDTRQLPSISIALGPDRFRAAVDRLMEAGVEALRVEPFWVGYWSYVVRDPDGRTIELSDPVSGRDPVTRN